jgi:hypothetical protein
VPGARRVATEAQFPQQAPQTSLNWQNPVSKGQRSHGSKKIMATSDPIESAGWISEYFASALVFIGKNSKEKAQC